MWRPTETFYKRLHDFLTLVVAFAALVVGWASYRVADSVADLGKREEVRAVMPILYVPNDSWTFDIKEPGPHRRFKAGYISFDRLVNIGRGPATELQITMQLNYNSTLDQLPEGICKDYMLFIDGRSDTTVSEYVPEHGRADASYEGTFPWANRSSANDSTVANIKIEIYYSDIDRRRYRTSYDLWATDRAQRGQSGIPLVGPDVVMTPNGEIAVRGIDSASLDDEVPGLSTHGPDRDEFPSDRTIDQRWIRRPCEA